MGRRPLRGLPQIDDPSESVIDLSKDFHSRRLLKDLTPRAILRTENPSEVFCRLKSFQKSCVDGKSTRPAKSCLRIENPSEIFYGQKTRRNGVLWIESPSEYTFIDGRLYGKMIPVRSLWTFQSIFIDIISFGFLLRTKDFSEGFCRRKSFLESSMERRPLECLIWMLRGLQQTDDTSGAFYEHRTLQGSFIDTNLPEIIYGCSGDFYGQKIPRVSSMDGRYF